MSITAKSIDVYRIEARLRKDDKETWNYINKLKESLAKQQELTGIAIGKIRELSTELRRIKDIADLK